MHKYLRHSQTNAKPQLLFYTAELMECSFKANNKVSLWQRYRKTFSLRRWLWRHFILRVWMSSIFSICHIYYISHFPLMLQLLTLISHPLLHLKVVMSLIDQPDKAHWEVWLPRKSREHVKYFFRYTDMAKILDSIWIHLCP